MTENMQAECASSRRRDLISVSYIVAHEKDYNNQKSRRIKLIVVFLSEK